MRYRVTIKGTIDVQPLAEKAKRPFPGRKPPAAREAISNVIHDATITLEAPAPAGVIADFVREVDDTIKCSVCAEVLPRAEMREHIQAHYVELAKAERS